MVWRRVDLVTGMHIEDVVNDAAVMLLENGELDPTYIAEPVPPDAGFYLPRWDGMAWVEGLTAEEIAARQAAIPPAMPTQDERLAALEAAMLDMMLMGGV